MFDFERLPFTAQLRVFELVRLDTRFRLFEVSRAWRNSLRAHGRLWKHSELSTDLWRSLGQREPRLALFQEALKRSGGGFETLTASGDWFALVHSDAVLSTLTELRIVNDTKEYEPYADETLCLGAAAVKQLLAAGPLLRILSLAVIWDDKTGPAMLKNEPPFGALRVRQLAVSNEDDEWPDDRVAWCNAFSRLRDAVMAHHHSCFAELRLYFGYDYDRHMMSELISIARARRLFLLGVEDRRSGVAYLVELLNWGMLRSITLNGRHESLLATHGMRRTLFLTALSRCIPLKHVRLDGSLPLAAVCTALRAFMQHPTIEALECTDLPEAGLRILCSALPLNTRLRKLSIGRVRGYDADGDFHDNKWLLSVRLLMLESFLGPAVRANRGLCSLVLFPEPFSIAADGQVELRNYYADEDAADPYQLQERLQSAAALERLVADRHDPAIVTLRQDWRVAYQKWCDGDQRAARA